MGYLVNDNRASGGKFEEWDTKNCGHCKTVIRKVDWTTEGGWCSPGWHPLCKTCARAMAEGGFIRKFDGIGYIEKGICIPVKKQVDEVVEKFASRNSLLR